MKNFYLKKIMEMLNDADERITRLAYMFIRGLIQK